MEAPRQYRVMFKGYHKIPSQPERNILWRVMRAVSLNAKKALSHVKKRKSRELELELDQESHLINDGIELRGDIAVNQITGTDLTRVSNRISNPARLKIYVKIGPMNKSMVVEAKGYHIVSDVKAKIHAAEGVKPGDYRLFHSGEPLEDYRTLASLGVRTESTLHLIFNPATLVSITVVTPAGKALKLQPHLLFTVGDVKTLVESLVGCPVSDCKMRYARRELDDGKSLAFYGVERGSVLELESSWMQILVRTWSSKTVTLYVRRSSTVGEVKEKLFCKVGVPILRQRIVFSGKRLEDDRDLASYDVQKGSTLHMILSL